MPGTTPAELDLQFAAELNAGNLDGLMALFEENAVQVREDRAVTQGPAELRAVMRAFVEMRPQLDLEVTGVTPLDDDVALVADRWTMTAQGPEGDRIEMNGRGAHIARRQHDGRWLFVATGLGNLIPNPR